MLQGLETGHATLGVVGTVSRSLVPALVVEMRRVAPALSLRLTEGASERLAVEVAERELASAVVTEPVTDPRLVVEHLRDEDLVGLVPAGARCSARRSRCRSRALAEHPVILPPKGNPLRDEVDDAARAEHVELRVPIEVEGIRLIADLVASGAGVSILPETAVPDDHPQVRTMRIARHAAPPARARSPRAACSSRWPIRPCTTSCGGSCAARTDRGARYGSAVVTAASAAAGAREPVGEDPADGEDHEPADRVDHVVVRGDDDHDEREHRVRRREDLAGAASSGAARARARTTSPTRCARSAWPRTGSRPVPRAGVERPERRVLVERVDEAA